MVLYGERQQAQGRLAVAAANAAEGGRRNSVGWKLSVQL